MSELVSQVHRLSACVGAALLLVAAAATQPTPTPAPAPAPAQDRIRLQGDEVIFALDEEKGLPFLQFIKFAQKVTEKKFYIDEAQAPEMKNPDSTLYTIKLLGTLTIKRSEFYAFFQTILFIKGWVCVPRGEGNSQFIDLIWQQGPRGQEIKKGVLYVPSDQLKDYRSQTGTFIVTTVKMRHINAQLASANLRTFWNDPRGLTNIVPIGGNDQRSLMFSGFGPEVYTMVRLLEVVDVEDPRPRAVLRVIDLEYSAVEDVEPILTELMSEKARQPAQPAAGGIVPPEDLIPVKILTNPNTNSLIVYAHEDRVREIENYVASLDTKATTVDSNFHVYKLINTLAKDMKETVGNFITQATQAEQQAQGQGAAPGGGVTRREQRPVIREDEKANALLISASRSQYEKIVDLIRQLDRPQDQVLIEAALIELGTQDIERLGVELGLLDIGTGSFRRPFGLTSFGLSQFQDTDGNGLPDTRLPDFENPLRGITGGILSGDDFAIPVLLNALKSDTESNVLSIPSVLVNNNENATVQSKDAFPTTRTDNNTIGTGTSFSGFQEAGIDLRISPSISEGNYVKLNLRLEVSKFTGTFDSTAGVPPPKTTRIIETVVTMPSGHTMVFGGVIEDTASETNEGIPFLKDLPLLGLLFRSKEITSRKTNLYFFLTPHILSDEDFADLAQLTFRKKLEAARYIGHKRLKVMDPNWRGTDDTRLEDAPSTIEDIDRLGGFDIPSYARTKGGEEEKAPTDAPKKFGGPITPDQKKK